jgi:hypothetical protein
MILSHQALNRLKDLGHLPRYAQVGPSSVDLHLSALLATLLASLLLALTVILLVGLGSVLAVVALLAVLAGYPNHQKS